MPAPGGTFKILAHTLRRPNANRPGTGRGVGRAGHHAEWSGRHARRHRCWRWVL